MNHHLIVIVNKSVSSMIDFLSFHDSDDRYNDNNESNSNKTNDFDGRWKSRNPSGDNIK
jgi:hypothetical protein